MSRQRRVLLALMGTAGAAAALGSFLFVQLDRMRSMDGRIASLKAQYRELQAGAAADPAELEQRIRELQREQSGEAARYYARGEMDLYRFSSLVSSLLARRGMIVERLGTVSGSPVPVVELHARGTALALAGFLSDVSARPKYWSIPYLHVLCPSGDGKVTCQMQIGYLVHEAAR